MSKLFPQDSFLGDEIAIDDAIVVIYSEGLHGDLFEAFINLSFNDAIKANIEPTAEAVYTEQWGLLQPVSDNPLMDSTYHSSREEALKAGQDYIKKHSLF
jgi:hypothetical protein